ncbi:tetratricopeptide repeat protein [Streptomyces sp. 24-1644]|uniref:tetratricopeptide repeat protein n=1 Tax=Streptomyces sp. 24-1644 TaxID=3457315 RepID=UPI003FA6A02F
MAQDPNVPVLTALKSLGAFRKRLDGKPTDRALALRLGESGRSPTTVGAWLKGERFPQDLGDILKIVDMIAVEASRRNVQSGQDASLLDEGYWRALYGQELERRRDRSRDMAECVQASAIIKRDAPGRPIRTLDDPFALDLHRAIEGEAADDTMPLLPVYIERSHDHVLRCVVEEAEAGRSRLVTLIGGSSTGKTRACWEAVQRLPDIWRLWHPISPSPGEAALASLDRVCPRTVIWLNDIHHYRLADPEVGERLAAGLRELLRTPERGPVLVLATVHPDVWGTLTAPAGDAGDLQAQARALLTGGGISLRIPDRFAAAQEALRHAAGSDPRVAEAIDHADDDQITQYLAGVPALFKRFENAPVLAQRAVLVAIDLRRLGHGRALPARLLEAAIASMTDDHEWNEHANPRWFDQVLRYLSAPCRGVPGPLTPIRPRPGAVPTAQPNLLLSDYLEEVGRFERRRQCPPPTFWTAALEHARTDEDRQTLARAARARGRVRLTASILDEQDLFGSDRTAPYVIDSESLAAQAQEDLRRMSDLHTMEEFESWPDFLVKERMARILERAGDREAADGIWDELAEMGVVDSYNRIGMRHEEEGRRVNAERFYRLGAEAGDPDAMQSLVFLLAEDRHFEEAAEWTERIAAIGDVYAYSRLAYRYEAAGDLTNAKVYFQKAVEAGLIDDYGDLVRLHLQEGDDQRAMRIHKEGVEAGWTRAPMLVAEDAGDHDQADEHALTAVDYGTVTPLRELLLRRLRQDSAHAGPLARKAIDAGFAWIVLSVGRDSASEHPQAIAVLQEVFADADEIDDRDPVAG